MSASYSFLKSSANFATRHDISSSSLSTPLSQPYSTRHHCALPGFLPFWAQTSLFSISKTFVLRIVTFGTWAIGLMPIVECSKAFCVTLILLYMGYIGYGSGLQIWTMTKRSTELMYISGQVTADIGLLYINFTFQRTLQWTLKTNSIFLPSLKFLKHHSYSSKS